MVRFLLHQLCIGLSTAIVFCTGLYYFDIGGLATLVGKSPQGEVALILLAIGLATLFAPLAVHTALARAAAEADDATALVLLPSRDSGLAHEARAILDKGAIAGFPRWLVRELRSDHAGETGAVAIYAGILAVIRDKNVVCFAESHQQTEREHLRLIESILPLAHASSLLPLWRIAGFLIGATPALFGRRAVFATIDAVESFVDQHYTAQSDRLARERRHGTVRTLLERCRQDELSHRDEARAALDASAGPVLRGWCWLVGAGSAAAVRVARLG
tara:strand:+ start:14400 stop:15221 length:822 start_codon:yes stop_codon:yes gene_type:complete